MAVDIGGFGPRLETERLILRVPEERDFESLVAVMGDEVAARHIGGVQEPAIVWRSLCAIVGHWALRGYGFFSIEDRKTGEWLGRVGPWFPHGWPQPEVGWTIKREAWGKGYASEAAERCLDWVFDELGWDSVVHLIHEDNHGSIGVAKKLGSTNWNKPIEVPGFGITVDQWGQTKAEWQSRKG